MRKKLDITTDKALVFSAIMILIFTIVMVVLFCLYQSVPDSLVMAFFGAFSFESGFCAFIYRTKKTHSKAQGDLDTDTDTADDEGVLEESEVLG